MKPSEMACLILASGLSQRFGDADKLQANLCGNTVLSHVINSVKAVDFGQTFIVTKDGDLPDMTTVLNKDPNAGQGHALQLGIEQVLANGWSNVMIVLGDMPLITTAYLKNMITNSNEKQSLISISKGQKSPPAIFPKSAMELILSRSLDKGARSLFTQLKPKMVSLDASSACDVDTPEDLARVAAIMKNRSK